MHNCGKNNQYEYEREINTVCEINYKLEEKNVFIVDQLNKDKNM